MTMSKRIEIRRHTTPQEGNSLPNILLLLIATLIIFIICGLSWASKSLSHGPVWFWKGSVLSVHKAVHVNLWSMFFGCATCVEVRCWFTKVLSLFSDCCQCANYSMLQCAVLTVNNFTVRLFEIQTENVQNEKGRWCLAEYLALHLPMCHVLF